MYSKVAEEEDNKMVERLRKDVDMTLIFVSLRVGTHYAAPFELEYNRPVYFLPLSPDCSH